VAEIRKATQAKASIKAVSTSNVRSIAEKVIIVGEYTKRNPSRNRTKLSTAETKRTIPTATTTPSLARQAKLTGQQYHLQ
jgi:hypothetical protein